MHLNTVYGALLFFERFRHLVRQKLCGPPRGPARFCCEDELEDGDQEGTGWSRRAELRPDYHGWQLLPRGMVEKVLDQSD